MLKEWSKLLNRVKTNKLASSSIIYLLSNGLEKGLPFLFLPIFTSLMSKHDFGIVSNSLVVFTIFKIIYTMSATGALQVKYFELSNTDRSLLFSTIYYSIFVNFLLLLIPIYLLRNILFDLTLIPISWLLLLSLAALFDSLIQVCLTLLRMREEPSKFALLSVLKAICDISLSLIIIKLFNVSWEGRISGLLLTQFLIAAISSIYLVTTSIKITLWSWPFYKYLLSFGGTLIFHELSSWIFSMGDRIFITKMISASANATYSIAYSFGMITALFTTSIVQAITPWLYKKLETGTESAWNDIFKFLKVYSLIVLICGIVLNVLFEYMIVLFFGPHYAGAIEILPWITGSYIANGIYMVISNILLYFGANKTLSMITFTAALVNCILNYYLIKILGVRGAAIATASSFLLMLCFSYFKFRLVLMKRSFKEMPFQSFD